MKLDLPLQVRVRFYADSTPLEIHYGPDRPRNRNLRYADMTLNWFQEKADALFTLRAPVVLLRNKKVDVIYKLMDCTIPNTIEKRPINLSWARIDESSGKPMLELWYQIDKPELFKEGCQEKGFTVDIPEKQIQDYLYRMDR